MLRGWTRGMAAMLTGGGGHAIVAAALVALALLATPSRAEEVVSDVPATTETGAPLVPDGITAPDAVPPEGEEPALATEAELPRDLTVVGMFLAADAVVKSVMIGLFLASVATWTVWLAKTIELAGARRRTRAVLEAAYESPSLTAVAARLKDETDPAGSLARAAVAEAAISADLPAAGIKERAATRLARIEAAAARQISRGTGILATIGAVAPFVGLFGTVWGIMNSFIGISRTQTTNLAVVAPGIAEALLATALGLIAAIPAVIIYNMFARSIGGYRALLADVSAEVMRHLSRDLDRAAAPKTVQRATAFMRAAE